MAEAALGLSPRFSLRTIRQAAAVQFYFRHRSVAQGAVAVVENSVLNSIRGRFMVAPSNGDIDMVSRIPNNAVTIKDIAMVENLHFQYVQKLAREKGFPDHVCIVGRSKLFAWRDVERFFQNRRKKSA